MEKQHTFYDSIYVGKVVTLLTEVQGIHMCVLKAQMPQSSCQAQWFNLALIYIKTSSRQPHTL